MSTVSTYISTAANAFTKEEEKEMWQFLRRKLLNAETGKIEKFEIISKSELWDEFKRETNGTRRCRDYEKRFDYKMAPYLHQAELGNRTKTELYYGLDIPVEYGFLEYLGQTGEAEIDEAGCLLKFKEYKQGGLDLGSDSVELEKEIKQEVEAETETEIKIEAPDPEEPECSNAYYERQRAAEQNVRSYEFEENPPEHEELDAFTAAEEMDMWIFLLQKLYNSRTGKVEKLRTKTKYSLWKEFKKVTKSDRRPLDYEERFTQHMANNLHSSEFDTKTKIELYYGLQIPVHPIFLETLDLEMSADIKLDRKNRIERYRDDDGMIDNNNNNRIRMSREPREPRDDEPECSNAYYERANRRRQISSSRSEVSETPRSSNHRRQKSSNRHRQNSVYSERPLKTEPSQKSNLYKNRTATPKPNKDVKTTRFFSDEEELNMWIFLLQKVKNPDTGKAERKSVVSNEELWREYKACSNGARSVNEYLTRYKFIMRDFLHLTRLTQQMKLELYFGLGIPVEPTLLKELKTNADVVVDRNGALVSYKERRTHGEKFMLGVEEVQIAPEQVEKAPPRARKQTGKRSAKQSVKQETPKNKSTKTPVKLEPILEPPPLEDVPLDIQEYPEYPEFDDYVPMPVLTKEASDASEIFLPVNNKRKKIVVSSEDSEEEEEEEEEEYYTPRRAKKKAKKPPSRKTSPTRTVTMYSDSEEENEKEPFVPEPPKFVRPPIVVEPYQGPFIKRNVYLNIIKNVLEKVEESEKFEELRKEIEEKMESCEQEEKLVSVGYMKHVIDSIIATALYS